MKMFRLLIVTTFLPLFAFAQKTDEAKMYSQAITEYLNALSKTDKWNPDTLFVGPDEYLHNIKLPSVIKSTRIIRLSPGEGDRKVEYSKPFVYVNIVGNVTKINSEFIFITFIVEKADGKPSWLPKHNCLIDYQYDTEAKTFQLKKCEFEYKYSNKYTKSQ